MEYLIEAGRFVGNDSRSEEEYDEISEDEDGEEEYDVKGEESTEPEASPEPCHSVENSLLIVDFVN